MTANTVLFFFNFDDRKILTIGRRLIEMNTVKLSVLPEGSLDSNNEGTDPLRYYYYPFLRHLFRKRIETGLSLLHPPYGRILEVGYGSGILLPTLSTMGRDVYGVDIASDVEKTKSILKKNGVQVTLFKADVSEWKFVEDKFDLVVAFSVFEHISDPLKALRQTAKLLKPNGVLLIGMPRVDKFVMSCLFRLIGYRGIDDHHITTYKNVLGCSKPYFRLQSIRTFPYFFPKWASLYFNLLLEKLPPTNISAENNKQW